MQLTALAVLLAAAGVAMATPVPAEPATDLTASDLPAGVTFIASNTVSGADNNKAKRGGPSDACLGTCWSGYSSGMCFWNCWGGQKCGYSVGTCQDKRWNE